MSHRSGLSLLAGSVLACAVASIVAPIARGQVAGDAETGRRLAERWCSTCHVVGPHAEQGTSTGAPPFEAIARMPSTTAMSLRVFLMTPHGPMPDLHLSSNEIDDLSAYIISLRHD